MAPGLLWAKVVATNDVQAHGTIWTIMVHLFTCHPAISPVKALRKTVKPDAADEIDEVEKGAAYTGTRPGYGDDSAHSKNAFVAKKVEE
jgi:hypothetical protein